MAVVVKHRKAPLLINALWCLLLLREYMEKYITLSEASKIWGISERRIRTLCAEGRIEGVTRFGRAWAIPADAPKPSDNRIKTGRYVKEKK